MGNRVPQSRHLPAMAGIRTLPWILHDIGDDHYHEEDEYSLDHDPKNDGLYQSDNVALVSVGIDIGSAGTQIVFSRIRLQRLSDRLSSRYFVVAREQLYQSPVALTPYAQGLTIDAEALAVIIDAAYRQAGIAPQAVDTGAVILTGEALRRHNAQAIADILAVHGGQFVSTMAGHHIEAMLAAYGSGAAWMSNQLQRKILNIDIGGGTTKFAIVEQGRVRDSAAIHIGGRLHVFDETGTLTRLEPAGQALAAEAGLDWRLGAVTHEAEREKLATLMAERIIAAVTAPEVARHLFLTDPLAEPGGIQGVMFSGGVSEYVHGRESRDFGDMGRLLGAALAAKSLPWPVLAEGAGIRATALGLSEYSVQLSGNTIYVSDPDTILPRRNLRVARPDCPLGEIIAPEAVAAAIRAYAAKYVAPEGEEIAYAFAWRGAPLYARIQAFAHGLALAFAGQASPITIVLDGDIARTLGHVLHDELHVTAPLLIVDGIELNEFDYVDFGPMRRPSGTVPVTIKSLLFSQDPRNLPRA